MTVEMLADLYKVRKGIQYTSLGVWFGRNRTRGCATWVSKPKLPCLGLLRELIIGKSHRLGTPILCSTC